MNYKLIERVEAATEGSRELDCLIAKEAGWFRYTRELGCTMKRGGWISPQDFFGTDSYGKPILDGLHGTDIHRDPPMFSRSLDSALTLVPEHHSIDLAFCAEMGSVARVYFGPIRENSAGEPTGRAATPGRALVAACLRIEKE